MSAIERVRRLARPSRVVIAGALALGAAGIALAADVGDPGSQVRALLKTRLPKTPISAIDCGKIAGLCEVTAGSNLFYVDRSARYLVIGRVFDMQTRQDITAARLLEMNPDMLVGAAARANAAAAGGAHEETAQLAGAPAQGRVEKTSLPARPRMLSLAGLPDDGAIVWGNPTGPTVTVFTDFRCGYCRALTSVLKSMNVRVIERPISVLGSRDLADRVYCARNREAALHAAYAGETPKASGACDTSGLDANEAFAHQHGLSGTPVIVRSDGAVIEGYRPRAFLQATAIYLCLMVPTVSVKVTDRLNPSLAPATVDNVPMGLGVLASFTTQVGDWLTQTAETVFVMPSELNYSSNGMVYGARLFDATRNFIVRDAEFSTNLESHFKNCVFGDVMLYQKSLTNLAKSTDLWAAIGPGSEARSQEWLERQGDGTVQNFIVTCRQAYDSLSAQWAPMIEANAPIWGKEAYPKLSNALAADKLKHDVPIVNAAFTGSGADFTEVMRQITAINAFMQARNSMSGGSGAAAIDTFAQTRADIQARNTYSSIAQQAMAWVPILNIVLTVVFFAMFPVIFPLFLMPQTGISTLKGYGMGFFYLAAWGPLYVILHMICMTRAESAANGVAGGGVTLGSYAGIGAVNGETATIAGFMLMSVPFLAAGLARGAMSIAGHSMSMLAPAQNAAEAAALEQTTGNYAYGNVSWANSTSNMRQADQWTTAPSYMGGGPSVGWRQDNGAVVSGFGNGQEVIDTSGAISRLGFTPTMTTGSVAEWREMASQAHRQAQAYENAAAEILTATHANRSVFGTSSERSSGWDSSSGSQANTSVEQFDRRTGSSSQGTEERSSISQSTRVSQGHDRQAQTNDQVTGSISAGLGGRGGSGAGAAGGRSARLPTIGGSVSKTGNQLDTLRHGTDESRSSDSASTSSSGVRDEHTNGTGASTSDGTYARSGVFSRASTTSSSSTSTEDSLALAKSYSETARRLEELSQQLSRDASYAETHGMQLSENLSQDLAQWYRQQQVNNPGLDAPELWATDLTDHQRFVRQEMVSRWMQEKEDAIRADIAGDLHAPNLVSVHRPSIDSAADVRGSYRPRGVGGLPGGPAGGNSPAAADIIEAGRKELGGARSSAEAMRVQRVQGSVDVQQEVGRNHDRGFFHDPKLRE